MSVLCGLFLFTLFRLTNGVGCCDLFFLNFTIRFVFFVKFSSSMKGSL